MSDTQRQRNEQRCKTARRNASLDWSLAALNAGIGTMNAVDGHAIAIFSFACMVILAAFASWQGRRAGRFKAELSLPDYGLISSMEREIYGRAYRHEVGSR